jgi:hypothetical protein
MSREDARSAPPRSIDAQSNPGACQPIIRPLRAINPILFGLQLQGIFEPLKSVALRRLAHSSSSTRRFVFNYLIFHSFSWRP